MSEFCLSSKQQITITKIIDAVAKKDYNSIGILLYEISLNEEEFIRLLKEEFRLNTNYPPIVVNEIIDKLAGEDLK